MGQGRDVAGVMIIAAFAAACAPQQPPMERVKPAILPAAVIEEQKLPPREEARRALEHFDKKEWDVAVPALTAAAAAYPEVAPFLRLRVAEAEVARGNVQNAIAVLSEVIAISDTSAATLARLQLPQLYAQTGDRAATDAAWAQANALPIDELTEGDFVSMASALAKAGRQDLATNTRMRLLTTYTQGRYTEQTFDFVKNDLPALTNEERIALAAKLAKSDRYDQALALLPPDAAEARATRIRALFNSRHYSELLAETEGLELTDPSLVMTRARAAWRADRADIFLAGLDAVEKNFPSSKEAVEAKILRAKYYSTDVIDYARAIDNLTKAAEAGANDENLWNLGWTYFLAGRYDEALQTFDRYTRTYPDGDWKTNSLFWTAKIHDKSGRTAQRDAAAAQIVAEYPFSYYAYRAKELWPSIAATETKSLATFPDVETTTLDEPRLKVVRALQDIGLDRAAAREMKVLAAKYGDNAAVQFMLADVYVRGGEPFKANGVLQRRFRDYVRHGGTNIPRRFWEVLFPLAYWDTIKSEAAARGHDPYVLASIIRQESGFEPSTVSNAGAVGLMQIMPEEASRIGVAGGLGEVTREDLFVPEKNVAVGAAELTQKLAATGNNLTLAIAAYNAGEAAVQRWMSRTPVEDIDVFIESIPYAETRLYVKTVTRNRNEYRRIYER
ncbi:MAG TPA: transglycosylase SLT domain-containing protein [Thermoanaerobaculia bacterium]|nr:transglycosylase SLT domain-containing protein [Thermoanaerobaculia bacterium]